MADMLFVCGGMILASLLWGATNPFIKKGSKGVNEKKSQNSVVQFIYEIKFLISNWKYMLPFIVNQCGSLVYYFTLQKADLSLAVPVVNSLTFIFTALSGWLFGEGAPNQGTVVGAFLVVLGITLCVADKIYNS